MPDKLIKQVAIAKSGIYKYAKQELPSLLGDNATPPVKHQGLGFFSVYRPATVLARAVDSFVRLPLTLEHPSEMVDGNNLKKYIVGFTGDSAIVDMTNDKKEVLIKSTLAIIDNAAVRAYYGHTIEVSPGYTADFKWEDGVDANNTPYQIVMTNITSVNHLAITRYGRGGSAACILDSLGDTPMQRKSGLIYAVRKLLGVKDAGKGFCDQVLDLINDRSKIDEKEIVKRVQLLRDSIVDLPVSDGKAKLDRFVEDLDRIKEESDESANEIVKIVNGLYTTLDKAAVEDVAYHTLVKGPGNTTTSEKQEMHETSESSESSATKKKEEGVADEKEEPSTAKEAAGEKKEDDKKMSEEKGGEKTEEKSENEDKKDKEEHKKADEFKEGDKDKGETIDSKVIDALADKIMERMAVKATEKKEPVMDSAIKRVMDSFKTTSSADKSPVKVDDSAKSSNAISKVMSELRGGK